MNISKNSAAGLRITVAGGGISGLAAAAGFATRGAEVTVCEQAPELTEIGAGIQISPNGLAVLDALGLAEAARAAGQAIEAIELRDGLTDRLVARLPLRHAIRPYLAFHRADLIDLLVEAARGAGAALELGQRIGPGAPPPADLLVAADGINSAFRPVLCGPAEPEFTGFVAWRAVIAGPPNARPVATIHMGPGRHLVSYPLRQGEEMNLVAVAERAQWADQSWSRIGDPAELRAAFSRFAGRAAERLSAVDKVNEWGLFRHPVAPHWHALGDRPMTLIGDAAHPTLPFLAQGANLALEDAYALPAAVDALGLEAGLPAFQRARIPRVTRAIDAATANARNYHHANPVARFLGFTGLRVLSTLAPTALPSRYRWLYEHDVTAEAFSTA